MKRSDYFYSILLLAFLALGVYAFTYYFWIMAGLIAFSSVFSFVVFLIQTRVKLPEANENQVDNPIDFYTASDRTSYYVTDDRKQVNAN